MEFQTLKKDNRKYWVIGIVVVLAIVATVFFVGTRAKYKNTDSIQVVSGTINYSSADLNVVAVNIESDASDCKTVGDKCYTRTLEIPDTGYELNTNNSYCGYSDSEGNITKDSNITINYHDGVIGVDGVSKTGTKCIVYFDKITAADIILANNTVTTRSDFSTVFTDNTAGKIYSAEDDDGTSYYFAGASPNNWVLFGGFYWRIIRINGDGTVRLIYNGTTTDQTGTGTQINTSAYNLNSDPNDNNMHVGYMYTKDSVHGTGTDSTIKEILDTWYSSNLSDYTSYIDTNAGYCNDRYPSTSGSSSNGSGGTGYIVTYYGAYIRLKTNKSPSLKCTSSSDLFTVSGASKGNKALTYPVGLITADEVAYAGGVYKKTSTDFWLYTNQYYWTMTPFQLYDNDSNTFAKILLIGGEWTLYDYTCGSEWGVRPVINLKADTVFSSGDGTSSNPYTV